MRGCSQTERGWNPQPRHIQAKTGESQTESQRGLLNWAWDLESVEWIYSSIENAFLKVQIRDF